MRAAIWFIVGCTSFATEVKGQITSGNPIITHIRCADPSAEVWNDGRVWIYASHDQDNATDYSSMDGYHVFSSYDMVHWEDHGEILHSRDVSWGIPQGGFMFAPDAAFKDGTYFLYFPHMAAGWNWRVGVATSDKPEGPFRDMGTFIEGTDHIDPTCFVDDDGEVYLIWGGDFTGPKIARLKENMVELAEEPRLIEYGADNFGEGAFLHKRDSIYYLSYTCQSCFPYQGFYAMGDNPYGPFTYMGELNPSPPGAQDHHSIIEFHGQWYYFYHVGNYGPGASLYRRNICVDSLFYNPDGSMQVVKQTTTGVGLDPIGSAQGIVIPGSWEAGDLFRQQGLTVESQGDTVRVLSEIDAGDWAEYVLDILVSEEYSLKIYFQEAAEGTGVVLQVDGEPTGMAFLEAGKDTMEVSLFLHSGRHVLKATLDPPDTTLPEMALTGFDLRGETEVFTVESYATGEGSIHPEGTFHVTGGDSLGFELDWAVGSRLEGIYVNDLFHEPELHFVLDSIYQDYVVEARFTACEGTVLHPYVQVNDGDTLASAEISVTEGDDLTLMVVYDDISPVTWTDPGGLQTSESSLELKDLRLGDSGSYVVDLTNLQGCRSRLEFIVTVNELQLDVFEAEHWSGMRGMVTDVCYDIGGGYHMSDIEDGDWSLYNIDLEKSGIYQLVTRVSTGSAGANIELSVDDIILDTIPVDSSRSAGWQDWYTTAPIELPVEAGNYDLKFTFRGGEGHLCNFNWFDLTWNRELSTDISGVPVITSDLRIYYPEQGGISLEYSVDRISPVRLEVYTLTGIHVETLYQDLSHPPGEHQVFWDGTSGNGTPLPEGIYLISIHVDQWRDVGKVLLTH